MDVTSMKAQVILSNSMDLGLDFQVGAGAANAPCEDTAGDQAAPAAAGALTAPEGADLLALEPGDAGAGHSWGVVVVARNLRVRGVYLP